MAETETDDPLLAPLIINSILEEHRAGRPVWPTYGQATICLNALGRPLRESLVRDLLVVQRTLNGRAVAPLSEYVAAADAYIARALARPNLKAQAAATARASRGRKPANDPGPADRETA